MAAEERDLIVHRQWMGLLQPVGLVVSPPALVECGAVSEKNAVQIQERLHEVVERTAKRGEAPKAHAPDLLRLLEHVLDWRRTDLIGPECAAPLPDTLDVALPDYGETLRATYAARDPVTPEKMLLLIHVLPRGTKLDDPPPEESKTGWHASPYAKFERLLRKTAVHTGLIANGDEIRLVHAPEHQTSGHLTFPVQAMTEVTGRPILAAFKMLLGAPTVFDLPDGKRLADILEKSRKYQNQVSNDLAEQVLGALWELLQGFQKADTKAAGKLLVAETGEDREHVYGGLLTALMRMVFVLYAEDQGLLPNDRVWVDNYSVAGLWTRLRDDAALHPDTMDDRYGAWATLLALFRIVHHGGGHGAVKLPARRGQLFDPDAYPFLEGRSRGSAHDRTAKIEAPRISDGCIHRVLSGLLVLDGERLSYRALDVEQIGSVYEAMMGYEVERLTGRSLAVKFSRKGIPGFLFFDVDALLAQPARDRVKWLTAATTCELSGKAAASLRDAATPDAVLAALERRASKRTPRVLPHGSLVLQPGEERRRSGSHYTPRELTKPIVETTLRPVLEALGPKPTPQQILDLKVCDPAMGSGAFLVEACRQLAERLVETWEHHRQTPVIPPDEDALLHAKRLIAQRCLYGVDKNPFAVNLAKLSLWLVTLARDHAFTFVDHALRHGDSLVGLSREQIVRFHWDIGAGKPMPLLAGLKAETDTARDRRREIGALGDEAEDAKRSKLAEADTALAYGRLAGDLVVAAFFDADKDAARGVRLAEYRSALDHMKDAKGGRERPHALAAQLRRGRHPLPPFHWEIEFPEVFARDSSGFDAVVGNPPFLGVVQLAETEGPTYTAWLRSAYSESGGKCDVVAFFFRRSYGLLHTAGAFGLVATNSISQGDTRRSGLTQIVAQRGTIYCARRRVPWPGNASVIVSIVHVARPQLVLCDGTLDGQPVSSISSFLLAQGGSEEPQQLRASCGMGFRGSMIGSQRFVFDDDRTDTHPVALANTLLAEQPDYRTVIRPYLGGDDIYDRPVADPRRFIIDFEEMSLVDAEKWPRALELVRGAALREGACESPRWWQHARRSKGGRAATDGMKRLLVIARTSDTFALVFIPGGVVISDGLVVFRCSTYAGFAGLQSRVHEVWARCFGSTLEERPRYTPRDVLETFPFPHSWDTAPSLEAVGSAYYELRAKLVLARGVGMTPLYQAFHDPDERAADMKQLRELHDAMDRAVLDAYGWTDIRPKCEFLLDYEIDEEEWGNKKKPYRYRWPDDVRDKVLGRLLELNRVRAEEERLKGVAADAASPSAAKVRRLAKAKRVAEMPEGGLFGGGDDDGEER